jgi:hypothetical protein
MPILGKRKYINEKIEKLINKLDILGYDTQQIKKRFYNIPDEQPQTEFAEFEDDENYYSSGSLLPYRNKINDVLKMIEELIKPKIKQNDYYDQSLKIKNDLIERVKNDTPQSNNNSSFSLGRY